MLDFENQNNKTVEMPDHKLNKKLLHEAWFKEFQKE